MINCKVNKIVIDKNGKKFDLNGLPISERGTTDYKGVRFGDTGWSKDCGGDEFGKPVFVAFIGLNKDEQELSEKQTFCHHLFKHENDVLACAYITMKFEEHRAKNISELRYSKTAKWDYGDIPKFEYPPIESERSKKSMINAWEAYENRRAGKVAKSLKRNKQVNISRKAKIIKVDNKSADANFDILCKEYNMVELASKFGREAVLVARKFLTINEFQLRFGL